MCGCMAVLCSHSDVSLGAYHSGNGCFFFITGLRRRVKSVETCGCRSPLSANNKHPRGMSYVCPYPCEAAKTCRRPDGHWHPWAAPILEFGVSAEVPLRPRCTFAHRMVLLCVCCLGWLLAGPKGRSAQGGHTSVVYGRGCNSGCRLARYPPLLCGRPADVQQVGIPCLPALPPQGLPHMRCRHFGDLVEPAALFRAACQQLLHLLLVG